MKFNANLYKSFNNLESKEAVENMSTKDIPLKKFKMTFFIKKTKQDEQSEQTKEQKHLYEFITRDIKDFYR